MGITDELRHEVADYPFRDNRDFAIFEAVADRIDAEHERTVGFCKRLEDAAAKREDVEIFGVEYTALPLDADGEPIRVGDVMEWVRYKDDDLTIVRTVSGIGNSVFFAWSDEQGRYAQYEAHAYRHHHAPTVEDLLQKLLEQAVGYSDAHTTVALNAIAEYAAKLRLADDKEE